MQPEAGVVGRLLAEQTCESWQSMSAIGVGADVAGHLQTYIHFLELHALSNASRLQFATLSVVELKSVYRLP